jgi:hypothetical protein
VQTLAIQSFQDDVSTLSSSDQFFREVKDPDRHVNGSAAALNLVGVTDDSHSQVERTIELHDLSA